MDPVVAAVGHITSSGSRTFSLIRLILVVAAFRPAASTSASDVTGPPYKPGDVNYWVKLHSLEVSEGTLEPQFEQDHTDYELHIRNTYSTVLVLTLGLDLQMYNLLGCPEIFVDGREIKYTPLNLISVSIPLNETIGPLDKWLTVQLNDPKHGSWLSPTNSMTYRVHITQPPEYEKILEARTIVVTDGDGQEIPGEPPFRSGSSRSSYHFNLNEDQTTVSVRVACSDLATSTLLDDEHLEPGTITTIDMTHHAEWNSLVHCKYYNPKWTPNEETRTYALSFSRTTKLGKSPPKLAMLQDYGICQTRSAYEAKLGKVRDKVGITDGFVCVSDRDHPRIMVSYDKEAPEVYLQSPDKQEVVVMSNYLPVTIEHNHRRQEFTLREHSGNTTRDHPVTFIWPAGCNTMVCPTHYMLRRTAGEELAAKRMCLEERCSDNDIDVCCARLATCDSLVCPLGKQASAAARTAECGSPVCGKEDVPHCCEQKATCGSYKCPSHMARRSDAAATYCGDKECSEEDVSRCCEERAPCGSYTCSTSSALRKVGRFCRSTVCGKEDEPHCCETPAACSTFSCPKHMELRKGAKDIECYAAKCTQQDLGTCCRSSSGLHYKNGVLQGINDDGTFAIRFDSGEVDNHVPEWALHGGQNHSNLRPGERVEASLGEDGYRHRNYIFGWVQKVHADRTYSVKYESGEVDNRVPAWALRAVDETGHIFVHSELFTEGERVIASRTHKGYHKEDFGIASVIMVNADGTYTVRFPSGQKEEHVPKWDLRAIDSRGHSYAKNTHSLGDNVEVNLGSKARGIQVHKDQLRTRYLLGHVAGANVDGTYKVRYDFGGIEDHVPIWAMRFLDSDLHSTVRSRFFVGDRCEARISMDTANNLTGWGLDALGIATREKVILYRSMSCWPAATKCSPMPLQDEALMTAHPKPPEVPPLPDYDVVANPEGAQLCYYDRNCSESKDKGCGHDSARPNCRFCGFGDFPGCPKPFDCSRGFPGDWSSDQKDWCCTNYNVGCPFECRWGKWWPDQVNGWGPWWTKKKRDWCCQNQLIGCPTMEDSFTQPTHRAAAAPRPTTEDAPEVSEAGHRDSPVVASTAAPAKRSAAAAGQAGQVPSSSPHAQAVASSDGEWESTSGTDTEWESTVDPDEDAETEAKEMEFKYEPDHSTPRSARWAAPGLFVVVASFSLVLLAVGLTLRRRRLAPDAKGRRGAQPGMPQCDPQQRDVALDLTEIFAREDIPLIP